MAKQILYSFELQPGMKVYEDVVDSSGRLILSKDLILDDETIAKLDFFSISEIAINDEEDDPEDSLPPHSFDYSEKVKSSPEYICFNADYEGVVKVIQNNLDGLMQWRRPLDTDMLINAVFMLIKDCKTTIQIFDVMYNLPTTDEPTYRHSLNVAIISVVLGRWIGLKRPDLEQLALAGILHDIGKLLLPVSLLNKQGKLTDEEFDQIKSHVKKGYNIVKGLDIDGRIKDSVIYHHERCDGSGYPFKCKLDDIPEFAKIIAIADVYDAMTSSRSYRRGICPFQVIQMFISEGLYKYDTHFIMTFLENISSSYLNNMVRLSDGRIGEIIMINKNCLYKPIVKIGKEFVDLMSHPDLQIEQII